MSKVQLNRPLCRFFLMGKCKYTEDVCTFSHRSEGDETIEQARKKIPCPFHANKEKPWLRCRHQSTCWFSHDTVEEEDDDELSEDLVCTVIPSASAGSKDEDKNDEKIQTVDEQEDQQHQQDASVTCALCLQKPVERGQRFALFSHCEHTCCYRCARKWHRNKHRRKAILARPAEAKDHVRKPSHVPLMQHHCPYCRKLSENLYPCKNYLKGEEKKAYIAKYISEQSKDQCQHYAAGNCPFGDECNFQHVDENGNDLFELHNARLKAKRDFLKRMDDAADDRDAGPFPIEHFQNFRFVARENALPWDWGASDDEESDDDAPAYNMPMPVSGDFAERNLANENPFTFFNQNQEERFHQSTDNSTLNQSSEDNNIFASVMAQYNQELAAADTSGNDEMERNYTLSFLRD